MRPRSPGAQLTALAAAARVTAPDAYAWFDRRITTRGNLESELAHHIYTHFYTTGWPVAKARPQQRPRTSATTPFVAALAAANAGTGRWERGWRREGEEPDGRVRVTKAGLTLFVDRAQCTGHAATTRVLIPSDSLWGSPGFYLTRSNVDPDHDEPTVRFYWSLTPDAAPALVAHATRALNEARLPFTLKVLADADNYERLDAGVLYIPQGHVDRFWSLLPTLHKVLALGLKAGAPALTLPLARGLSLAEDPGEAESFGQHRCRLLAQGLARAHEANARSSNARLATIARVFEAAGLSVRAPHLRAGSTHAYPRLAQAARQPF